MRKNVFASQKVGPDASQNVGFLIPNFGIYIFVLDIFVLDSYVVREGGSEG